jgi:hypothetical protein
MVGNWLYGVAHQTALQARRTAARRKARERQVTTMPDAPAVQPDPWPDVAPVLDQELNRLPDMYRAVIVLCELEGRTRKQVARQLGVPEGTVAGRLTRGRALLAKRLARRGVTLSGAALAAVLSQNQAAGAPAAAVADTIRAAGLIASGQTSAAAISPKVVALTEAVLNVMLMNKLQKVAVVALVLGVLATGAAVLAGRSAATQGDRPPVAGKKVQAPQNQQPKQEKKPFTAWGMAVGGLQAGIGLPAGAPRVYKHGETVTLFVRVRNVGMKPVKFEYLRQFLDENPPTVTGANGTKIPQTRLACLGFHVPEEVTLEPGQEIVLESRIHGAAGQPYELMPAGGEGKRVTKDSPLRVGTGKVTLQYPRVFGNSSAGALQVPPMLSKLATGTLELGITPHSPPAAIEKK